MLEMLLNSPLIWILSIGLLIRGFVRFNTRGLLSEKDYYHSLHCAIENFLSNKKEE
jgi:hypothetical protein